MKDNINLVIVGHMDHGKSTLIGRLLYDTNSLPEGKIEEIKEACDMMGKGLEYSYISDALEEERDQNVTIDTTQIHFSTNERNYTIIDAPGHVEFIKNMVTGASQADVAILIVDIKEGIKEQTIRHAYILKMLGIKELIMVINKMDKVNYSYDIYTTLQKKLILLAAVMGFSLNNIIPISAKSGDLVIKATDNMSWWKGKTLLEALNNVKVAERDNNKPLRFAVQDVYAFEKRIIVGRVESGTLRVGDEVINLPTGNKSRIASIEEFEKDNIIEIGPGKVAGMTLEDKLFIERGDVISDNKHPPLVVELLNVNIFWMDKEPLRVGEKIIFKCSTQERICEIIEFTSIIDTASLNIKKGINELNNREVAFAQIKLDKPTIVEDFNETPELGRFVLERLNVCAGGTITDILL